jgi:deazaflavin-dependent oxidoreductase (nitroreductase family)
VLSLSNEEKQMEDTPMQTPTEMPEGVAARYLEPGWFTRNVFNRAVRRLTRLGVSVLGSRELRVQGRRTGAWHTVPVNLLTVDGTRYLVAPRGETQWVRNVRVSGGGELRVGRHVDAFRAIEVDDAEKPVILRAYLRRWKAEVGVFFDGVGADASDAELAGIAGGYPVFRVEPA